MPKSNQKRLSLKIKYNKKNRPDNSYNEKETFSATTIVEINYGEFLFSNSAHIRLALPQAAIIVCLENKKCCISSRDPFKDTQQMERDLRAGFKPTTFHLPDHRPAIYVTLLPQP